MDKESIWKVAGILLGSRGSCQIHLRVHNMCVERRAPLEKECAHLHPWVSKALGTLTGHACLWCVPWCSPQVQTPQQKGTHSCHPWNPPTMPFAYDTRVTLLPSIHMIQAPCRASQKLSLDTFSVAPSQREILSMSFPAVAWSLFALFLASPVLPTAGFSFKAPGLLRVKVFPLLSYDLPLLNTHGFLSMLSLLHSHFFCYSYRDLITFVEPCNWQRWVQI